LTRLKKILWGVAAALTTPEAIKAEKSLATIVLTRAAILVPAAAGVIAVVVKLLGG
jgi:hypothetical protein